MKVKFSSIALLSAWSLLQAKTALTVTERARRHATAASCSTVPTSVDFNVTSLPSPFTFLNGTAVASEADFTCRQAELDALLQEFELGAKPDAPSVFAASLSGNTITIIAGNGTTNITWTVPITLPTASNATAPYPAFIAIDGISIPEPPDVAILTLDVDNIAQQNDATSRGIGIFYELYGTNATAGALMAWAWAVSRIIDALELIPVSQSNIDVTKLAVTGCSRDGKGALVAGAFDERIALTIPQESGSGGTACWRLSDYEFAEGNDVQTAHEIVMENVWLSLVFDPFVNQTETLPFDHHSLASLIAPRALLVIDNPSNEWLSPWSCFGCMETARLAWSALGVPDNMGYSQVGNHSHCVFPTAEQGPLVTNFVNKFLFGDTTANTTVASTDAGYTFNLTQWTPWPVPSLGSSTGTTTSVSSSSASSTTSSAPVATQTKYGQCGGQEWQGLTACASGTTCQYSNAYYSQCL